MASDIHDVSQEQYKADRERRLTPEQLRHLTQCTLRLLAEHAIPETSDPNTFAVDYDMRILDILEHKDTDNANTLPYRNGFRGVFTLGRATLTFVFNGDDLIMGPHGKEIGYALGKPQAVEAEPIIAQAAVDQPDTQLQIGTSQFRIDRILELV